MRDVDTVRNQNITHTPAPKENKITLGHLFATGNFCHSLLASLCMLFDIEKLFCPIIGGVYGPENIVLNILTIKKKLQLATVSCGPFFFWPGMT